MQAHRLWHGCLRTKNELMEFQETAADKRRRQRLIRDALRDCQDKAVKAAMELFLVKAKAD